MQTLLFGGREATTGNTFAFAVYGIFHCARHSQFRPGADLGEVLTDFLNERRRRKLLGGSGGMLPPELF